MQRMGGSVRVVALDLRGFGESEAGPADHSIADLADDVAGLMDHLSLDRAVIGGLSMGGYVALAFAARHANRLDGLVLADTRATADTDPVRQARDEGIAVVREHGVMTYVERQLPRLLSPAASEATRRRVRELASAQTPAGVERALRALRDRPDRTGELSAISCPTLVVVGEQDAITPPAEAAGLAAAITGAQLVTLSGAGHLSNIEAPEAFDDAVQRFLRQLG